MVDVRFGFKRMVCSRILIIKSLSVPQHTHAKNSRSGGGFVYYPSGNVAVCVSVVNSYQKNFFFYEDDQSGSVFACMYVHSCELVDQV